MFTVQRIMIETLACLLVCLTGCLSVQKLSNWVVDHLLIFDATHTDTHALT